MKDGNMTVAHIGKGKDTLSEVPAAPKHLSAAAKKGYKMMGQWLCNADRLKTYFLPLLEIFAEAYAEWEWSCNEINRKNKHRMGSGYIQVFATGATNITGEMSVRKNAASAMWQCAKQFGLDPKSEKELKGAIDNAQTAFDFDSYLAAK